MDVLKSKRKKKKRKKPNGFNEKQTVSKKADIDIEKEIEQDIDTEEDLHTNLVSSTYDENLEKIQKYLLETIGNSNSTVILEAYSYLDNLPIDVIHEALLRTARKQKKWDYARGTLNNWIRDGLDTLKKIEANDIEFKNKDAPKQETEEEKIARKTKELEEAIKRDNN